MAPGNLSYQHKKISFFSFASFLILDLYFYIFIRKLYNIQHDIYIYVWFIFILDYVCAWVSVCVCVCILSVSEILKKSSTCDLTSRIIYVYTQWEEICCCRFDFQAINFPDYIPYTIHRMCLGVDWFFFCILFKSSDTVSTIWKINRNSL